MNRHRYIDRNSVSQLDGQVENQSDRQTVSQTDRQTEKRAGRVADQEKSKKLFSTEKVFSQSVSQSDRQTESNQSISPSYRQIDRSTNRQTGLEADQDKSDKELK